MCSRRRAFRPSVDRLEGRQLLSTVPVPTSYSITDLGSGYGSFNVAGMNARGQIAGNEIIGGQPFLSAANGGKISTIDQIPGASYTNVFGVNDYGVVVGFCTKTDGSTHLVESGPNGAPFQDLGEIHSPSGGGSRSGGINNSGQIVTGIRSNQIPGTFEVYDPNYFGSDPNGVHFETVTIPYGGSPNGTVPCLSRPNSQGQFVGTFSYYDTATNAKKYGVCLEKIGTDSSQTIYVSGGFTKSSPSTPAGWPVSVNDAGYVSLIELNQDNFGSLHIYDTSMGEDSAIGGALTLPTGINNGLEVCGFQGYTDGRPFSGFLENAGTITSLNGLIAANPKNLSVSQPLAINDSGQIVSYALDASNVRHTVFLTPLPTYTSTFTDTDGPGIDPLPNGETAWTYTGLSGVTDNTWWTLQGQTLPTPTVGYVQSLPSEGGISSITQQVTFNTAGKYTISVQAMGTDPALFANTTEPVGIYVDGTEVGTINPTTSWATYTSSAFTVTTGQHTVSLVGLGTDGFGAQTYLTNVSIQQA